MVSPVVTVLTPRLIFRRYLMASYLYYVEDNPCVEDEVYDAWCRILHQEWDNFEDAHKSLVTREDLESGSGFSIKTYPNIVIYAAKQWRQSLENHTLEKESVILQNYINQQLF